MTDPHVTSLDQRMREYQSGSVAAFEVLYGALAPRLRAFIRTRVRDEARTSDLLQETFLEIHRSRHTFLPGHSVAGWAFGVAQNVLLRHLHLNRRRDANEASADVSELQSGVRDSTFELQALQDALEQLSPQSRATWWMRHVEGLSFDAIARQLGIAATAVRLRCSRASRALRAALEGGADDG